MDPEDPDSDSDHSQNLIISSFYLFRHILKISSKSAHKFLSYLVHKLTNKLTNKPRRKHNLLGGDNNSSEIWNSGIGMRVTDHKCHITNWEVIECPVVNAHIFRQSSVA